MHRAESNKRQKKPFRYVHVTPKESVDWRREGVVGPIKSQHVNGSKVWFLEAFFQVLRQAMAHSTIPRPAVRLLLDICNKCVLCLYLLLLSIFLLLS